MPYKVHETAVHKQMFWHTARPDEPTPEVLPENWQSTPGRGLPVVEIPIFEFPRVLYLHPRRPFKEVEHRNSNFEVVGTEQIPTEHLTKVVGCEAHIKSGGGPADCEACCKVFKAALAQGWTTKPYIPQAPEKPDSDLYGAPTQQEVNLLEGKKETKNETR